MNIQSQPARNRLPHRRQAVTTPLIWNGQKFFLTFGFNEHGRIAEVFGDSAKIGTDLAHLLSDACTVISVSLQRSATLQELAHSAGQLPDAFEATGFRPASLIGAILKEAITLEQEVWA